MIYDLNEWELTLGFTINIALLVTLIIVSSIVGILILIGYSYFLDKIRMW